MKSFIGDFLSLLFTSFEEYLCFRLPVISTHYCFEKCMRRERVM